MARHAPGCVLDPMHMLRHAVAAASGYLGGSEDQQYYDQKSAAILLDTLAMMAETDQWASTTLGELAIAHMDNLELEFPENFATMCSCGASRG